MDTTKNIINSWPATSYNILPNSEDQISQLTQKMLDFIRQTINLAIAQSLKDVINKALDQTFRQECRRSGIEFNDLAPYDIWDIFEKDWRPEKIRFFDPNCKKSGLVIIINCHIYYQDVYTFVDQFKDIALLQLMKKTQAILP